MGFWTYIGITALVFVAYKFLIRIGKGLPVLELMLLIAGLQWILGPLIEYSSPSGHYKYFMYVEQSSYMSFVVPAYIMFAIFVFYFLNRTNCYKIDILHLKNYSDYGVSILIIGIFFDVFGGLLPNSLGFVSFILSNFKFVGAIILFNSQKKTLRYIFYGAIIYLLIISIFRALFHDLILWSTFFYMFWALKNTPSIQKILLTFIVGGFLALTLQTVKSSLRTQVFDGFSGNKIELFMSLMVNSLLGNEENLPQLDDGVETNVRLNQGWIISAVLDHIPANQEYLHGGSIRDAVFASILPRMLNPNKIQAGGQENFRRFTGLELNQGTSMGISIVGEAYGNFARVGGVIFMGVWGAFLGVIWLFLYKKISKNIIFIAFIPLIFLQVIKAETELVVVLNHLVKSMMVVFAFLWFAKNYLHWNFNK